MCEIKGIRIPDLRNKMLYVPLILFYLQTGALDPADIESIQCIVGRVEDQVKWGSVNHSGLL